MLPSVDAIKYLIIHSIFSPLWLVKTTRIIHHNQLLLTKFEQKSVWLNKWRQKYSPLQIIEPFTKKTWERGCAIFGEQKKKEQNGETPLKTGIYFEWIRKQLLNSAFLGYEEVCRSLRVLSTSSGLRPRWITPSLICRILHILLILTQ